VASITISPPIPQLHVGQTVRLRAVAGDAEGRPLPDRVVHWATSDAAVASVAPSGALRALAEGETIVSATMDGMTRSIQLTVGPAPRLVAAQAIPAVAVVDVAPTSLALTIAATGQLRASVRDSAGNLLPDRSVRWNSSNNQVADVSINGLVIAKAAGAAQITASSEGRSASATVVVSAPAAAKPPLPPPDPVPAIRQLLDQYVQAIQARSVARILELYPALSASSRRDWERLFHDYDEVAAELIPETVQIASSGATAAFDMSLRLANRREQQRIVLSSQVALQLDNGGWRFQQILHRFSPH